MITEIVSSILIIIMCLSAYGLGMLSVSGALSAIPVGIVTMLAGPEWFIIILYFLLVGSITTKYKKDLKKQTFMVQEKGGARRWINIISNGFWPSLAAFLSLFIHISYLEFLYIFYVSSISSMAADTAATELGLIYRNPPRLITNIKHIVVPGTSGGITPIGTAASILVSATVGLVAIPGARLIAIDIFTIIFVATFSGFIGSIIDSILGATLQGTYKCKVCGVISENVIHCGEKGDIIRGVGFINNHMVNFISSMFAGIAGIFVYSLYLLQ